MAPIEMIESGINPTWCKIPYQIIIILLGGCLISRGVRKSKGRWVDSKKMDALLSEVLLQIFPITVIVFAEEENGINYVAS